MRVSTVFVSWMGVEDGHTTTSTSYQHQGHELIALSGVEIKCAARHHKPVEALIADASSGVVVSIARVHHHPSVQTFVEQSH